MLNSKQDLNINESFEIDVDSIDLPRGGARRRITNIHGQKNFLKFQISVGTIQNEDQLCMARAIGVKLHRCTPDEWKYIPRQGKSNLDLVLDHSKVSLSYY